MGSCYLTGLKFQLCKISSRAILYNIVWRENNTVSLKGFREKLTSSLDYGEGRQVMAVSVEHR